MHIKKQFFGTAWYVYVAYDANDSRNRVNRAEFAMQTHGFDGNYRLLTIITMRGAPIRRR